MHMLCLHTAWSQYALSVTLCCLKREGSALLSELNSTLLNEDERMARRCQSQLHVPRLVCDRRNWCEELLQTVSLCSTELF